jgi:hypothetical protein
LVCTCWLISFHQCDKPYGAFQSCQDDFPSTPRHYLSPHRIDGMLRDEWGIAANGTNHSTLASHPGVAGGRTAVPEVSGMTSSKHLQNSKTSSKVAFYRSCNAFFIITLLVGDNVKLILFPIEWNIAPSIPITGNSFS